MFDAFLLTGNQGTNTDPTALSRDPRAVCRTLRDVNVTWRTDQIPNMVERRGSHPFLPGQAPMHILCAHML